MTDYIANFELNQNNIDANFSLENIEFDALFEINPAVANWGNITGNLADQTDLKDALDAKADIQEVNTKIQNEATTRAENDSLLQGNINTLNTNLTAEINARTNADSGLQTQITQNATDINSLKTTILDYGDIVTYDAADFATAAQGQKADSALQPNDNITLLNNNAGFITNAVNDLTNYYKKTETYTKTEVNNLIASIPQFTVQIVQTLPQTGERMVLYLVPKDSEAPDVYNEYIWIENTETFELIGSTAVDLDGYATEEWVQNQGYATETYVDNGLSTKQNVLTAGENITISGDTISATDTTYTAGTDIEIVKTPSTSTTVSGTDTLALNNAVANTLQNVTVSGITEQKALLTDYQRVQFLESTDAGQYIDLGGVFSTATDDIEVTLQLTTLSNTMNLVGARNSTTDKNYNIGAYGTSEVWRWGWKGNSNSVPDVALDTNKHTFYIDHANQTISIDGVVAETRVISGNITTPTTPILFGVHATSATLLYLTPVRIYEFKKWRSGELVQHLIPCRRISDNELGMYDYVTGDFLTNAGDGDFVAGADITNPTPDNRMPIWCNNGMLKVSGNLLNRNDLEGSYLLTDEGQKGSSNDNWILTNFIKVKPNTSYIFDFVSGGDSVYRRVCGYSTNDYNSFTELLVKKQRPVTEDERFSEPFTTSATTNYIKVSTYSADTNVQIIEGTVAIPYRAYGEIYADGTTETITDSLSNTATAEMLLSTGNNTDTQEILTGAITRNTAIKVLKGTENWIVNSGDYNFYRLNSSVNYSGNLSSGFYCTHFKPASVASTTNNQGIRLNGNAIFLRWDELYPANSTNLSLFKQWLADQYANGTPVILVYPITTAETETVTGQTLNVQNNNNILTATGALTNLPISATYTAKEINTINFTNDSGYIKGIDSTDVTDALGYTPVNPSSLATVATSGSYNDLTNKPTIPSAQVNSDWNASSGVAEILNKPNLATVATSGSYNDLSNKPTIPSEVTESTVSGWGFTKNEGTVTSVNNTQPDASGNVEFIPPIAYATSTTAAATVQKEVSIPEITELNVGQIIVVQPTITSTVANSTLKLNDFDAYPMRYSNAAITTSTDSTVWSLNYPSQFVFDGTYWVFLGHGTDTNTTYTINYSIDAGAYKAGVGNYAITRYSLCMQKPDMTWEKVTATSATYSTGTSKSVNTNGFILGNIRYYNTTAIIANGANTASNTMNEKAATLDFRYSTNCGTTPAFNTGDYIYFVGTIGVDGLFYLDTTTWWTNTLPTTNDGKLYVQLGKFLADYNISLYENHPAYYYDGNKLCEYKVADNKQNTISDLATIRSGATLGATAVQPSSLATVATSGDYDDLTNKPTIPAAQVQSDWNQTNTSAVDYIKNKPTIPSVVVVDQTYDGTSTNAQSGAAIAGELTKYPLSSTLASVATSGSYNDLSNKPTIPTVNNATLTIQKNGTNVETFTANASSNVTANITVPTKISDLTDDTATYPIDKADTLTGLTASITELNYTDGVTSAIQTQLNDKQATLVSGTNIKTINNTSLLGSGNIDTSEVFVAEYGVTTFNEIKTAITSGKIVLAKLDSLYYNLTFIDTSVVFQFSRVWQDICYMVQVISTNSWSSENYIYQKTSTAVTHTASTAVGNSTTPVYIASNGVATSTGWSIASSRFDGQWVLSQHTLSSVATKSSTTIDISSYLPDNIYDYEVMIYVTAHYSSTNCAIGVGTVASPLDNDNFAFRGYVRSNSTEWANTCILPVLHTDRNIYSQRHAAVSSMDVVMRGYRRIGTNS